MAQNLNLSDDTWTSYRLLKEAAGLAPVEDFSLLEMTGEDRKEWLQGQCTNDLRLLNRGGSIKFCVCTPTGQLLSFCTLWELADRFLISAPTASVAALLERAETMVIMEDVALRDVTSQFDWLSIQGPLSRAKLSELLELSQKDVASTEPLVLKNGLVFNVLLPNGAGMADRIKAAFPLLNAEATEIARIEAGIPLFGVDTTAKTLPPELGPKFEAEYISYGKGCYTGQEVLMRIHSRGHTNRVWMGLLLSGPAECGDKVFFGEEEVGALTSFARSPEFGFIGTAYVRNEAAVPGTQVMVADREGEVISLPFEERE